MKKLLTCLSIVSAFFLAINPLAGVTPVVDSEDCDGFIDAGGAMKVHTRKRNPEELNREVLLLWLEIGKES